LVLAAAALLPLLVWGWLGRSLFEGALAVAPPVGPLLAEAARAVEAQPGHEELAARLRGAELHLVQAGLARRRLVERAPLSFAFGLAISGAFLAVGAWMLGRRLSRPVETLAAGMARFSRGELSHEVPVSGRGDELDYLAVELNQMGRELARQRARLQVTEALAAWRDAARALAHDLKNPLTAMRMALGRLTRPERSDAAVGEALALLQDELDVLIRMSQTFSEFARLPDPERRLVELAPLVRDVARLYEPESLPTRITVEIEREAVVLGDVDQLRRALGNLVKNAVEASRAAGQTGAINVRLAAARDPGEVSLIVRDDGVGLAAPIEGAALMRGLTSAKPGADRGLGLPIAHKIAHDHGGRIRLAPATPRGAEAVLELPLAAEADVTLRKSA
jgi:two-component system, NtrC family, nitrogen regulation sensor histidine kinase NtrY